MPAAKRRGLAQNVHGESNEVTKDLRERVPLPRDIWPTWSPKPGLRGSDRIQRYILFRWMTEAGYDMVPAQRLLEVNLQYPLAGRDTAKSGMGQR
jgi:hypothetical protein